MLKLIAGRARPIVAAALVISTVAIGAPPVSAANDANLVPINPARILETRRGNSTVDSQENGVGRLRAGTGYAFQVAGRVGIPADASAAYMNVTAVNPGAAGNLRVYPCASTADPAPNSSNLNYVARTSVANGALSKLGPNGKVCVFTTAETDVIVDVGGYVPVGGAPVSVDPARYFDSRPNNPTFDNDPAFTGVGRIPAGQAARVKIAGRGGVPADAQQVMLNVTAIAPEAPGYLTVFPCGELPGVSSVNYLAGQTRPNAALATLDPQGYVCVYTLVAADLAVDVTGYLPVGGNRVAYNPVRCLDSRGVTTLKPDRVQILPMGGFCPGIPENARAVYLNVTAVSPTGDGYITIAPCPPRAEDFPNTSSLNFKAGVTTANAVLSRLNTESVTDGATANVGDFCIRSLVETNFIIDVVGFVPA